MDHKVSKDMISSGMIPSGEKTQADLGRTQYGSAPSPSSLMDAYKSIYEHHQKDADGNVIPHEEKEELNEGKMPEGLKNYLMKKGKKEDKKEKVDEGIIDDVKSAGKAVYSDVKSAIKNRYNKFKDHSKARSMGLKGGKISPDGVYSSRSKDGGFSNIDLRFDTDLFDLVKGDLINEGLTDSEASRMMLEMHEEITFLYEMDRMGGPAAIAGILGAAAMGGKKLIDGVKGMKNKLQQKTQQKNKMIQQSSY